ncbi:MAG: AAA family ATPase, partial [Gammaproteobacteria bacterium]|nr:AAA family ATPase [Gammaproteobacteria bacterium]
MAVYERAQVSTLFDRLSEKPQRLAIVTGPRQTGKTTLVHQVLGHLDGPSRYVSVDEPDLAVLPPIPDLGRSRLELAELQSAPLDGPRDARWLVMQWEQARVNAESSDRGLVLAIDEIQKIPNWSETVKGLWDADRRLDRHLHVILLGSAPLLMQQGLSESLAGRYET